MRIVFCPAVIGFAASLVEEIKEIKEILLPSLGEAFLPFLPFLRDDYYLTRIVFYCPAVIGFAASLVEEMKEIKKIQVSDVALGRPSASKLQGQELQKVK